MRAVETMPDTYYRHPLGGGISRITNLGRLRLIDYIRDAIPKMDVDDVPDITKHMWARHLTPEECISLIEASVKFMRADAEGTIIEELRKAGFDMVDTPKKEETQ